MKTRYKKQIAIVSAAVAMAAKSAQLGWDPPPPGDAVKVTLLQVMDLPSSNVVTYASTNLTVTIPGGIAGRMFRAAHSNDFGLGEWTKWHAVPAGVTNLKAIVALVP